MELWINPSCSKCQVATELLDEAGAQYTVRRYLEDPPTVDELNAVLRRLGLEPWDIARMNEPLADELDLAHLPRDRRRWLDVMAANPLLIQRPLITADDGTTVIGRSEEAVRQALRASTPS
ncbi:arsenate reductase [Blastococcus mobilis]|uniref:Arsenate reductase n=1 Tax=Blastococcus mobilis TaxID=1938746 RepID=A0A238ZFP9_9ACTN|nr:arsenate reductase [Blastococcus mobilis]